MNSTVFSSLHPYIAKDASVDWQTGDIPTSRIANFTPTIKANALYYDNSEWARGYFEACHRDKAFKECWQAASGSWDDKIVVDIGCGPGNLYATLGGSPRLLIGVDISRNCLKMAQAIGYAPILADAHNLPFIDEFADIVAVNATLHHCDNMNKVLAEAARLVRPGGLLITDHDPQQTAWDWKGLAMLLYKIRVPIYRLMSFGKFMSTAEHDAMLATETHHQPGDGLTTQFYYQILEPLGFSVKVYPHNHTLGAQVLQNNYGQAQLKYRYAQWLSGINSNSSEAALSLMCIARRN
ncbi:class I SAM-dependent methyltransferase [Nostocaceae cyanobacterium CENA357]|uniref:Class I SAM-dependent methyltransferase n=1 Tax=Atlanticothrix silvestris CENA357 TaxID=1725252 RepID=A0A8J7HEA0_9CYAN|nr:class I SAM-dependent methyltransferase [Atlanticothrix silvestris]MBH8554198.1 class I SAM-dependent methyltransferase [Atlanticothrix silvestris CENA357]